MSSPHQPLAGPVVNLAYCRGAAIPVRNETMRTIAYERGCRDKFGHSGTDIWPNDDLPKRGSLRLEQFVRRARELDAGLEAEVNTISSTACERVPGVQHGQAALARVSRCSAKAAACVSGYTSVSSCAIVFAAAWFGVMVGQRATEARVGARYVSGVRLRCS